MKEQQKNKLLITLLFTLVISMMSATMFNIVLADIAEEFNLTVSQVSWLTSSNVLVFSVGTVMYGKLADTYRLKNIVTFGFIVCRRLINRFKCPFI